MTSITIAISSLIFYFIVKLTLARIRRPKLPSPDQEPIWRRLFKEPSPTQLVEWALNIPNDGLIRYRGALNKEKIIVCSIEGAKTIAEQMPDTLSPEPGTIKMLEEVLGNGLVSSWGDEHKRQRKQLLPVFKIQTVRGLYPIFWSKTIELLSVLEEESKKSSPIEITEIIHRASLDIIGLTGFGMDFNCLSEPDNKVSTEYATAFGATPEIAWACMLHRAFPSLHAPLSRLLKFNEASHKALSMMRKRITQVIEQRRAKPDSINTDLISILLHQNLITDAEKLLDQSLTILGAGHDTIASTLSLIIYHLAKYPSTQHKLRQEIQSILPSSSSVPPTQEILEKLESTPYLQALLNETLRLYPIIPWTAHLTTAPTQICGHVLPAGISLFLLRGAIHRKPDLWSSPSEFIPERWTSPPKERLAFLGFGAGPRNCIGEKFARSEVAILLAGLVGTYEFELEGKEEDVKLEWGIVLKISGGLWVRVKKLEGK